MIGIGSFVQALGVDKSCLYRPDFKGVPVMVSRSEYVQKRPGETSRDAHARPLREQRRGAPRGRREVLARYFAQDSSAFVIVEKFGGWIFDDRQWADDVDWIFETVGAVEHVATRDLMCEPWMLEILKTTVRENQDFTLRSFLELRALRPHRPWMPTLQGWEPEDYERHADMYEAHGVDLAREPLVGVGSVCKRKGKSLRVAPDIFRRLKARGLKFHAFGFDIRGTEMCVAAGVLSFDGSPGMVSGDSRGGGAGARTKYRTMLNGATVDPALYLIPGHDKPGPGRRTGHKNCGCGCPEWDLRWRAQHVQRIAEARARHEARKLATAHEAPRTSRRTLMQMTLPLFSAAGGVL